MSGFCGYTKPVSGKTAGSLVSSLRSNPDKSKPLADTEGFIRWETMCGVVSCFTLYIRKPSRQHHYPPHGKQQEDLSGHASVSRLRRS
jgi:hypothetical protein